MSGSSRRPLGSGLALITGASAGIGREFSRQLARAGQDLVLGARDAERLSALAKELTAATGVAVESLPADLSREEEVSRVAARIGALPRLTLLVNNAGFGTTGTLALADPELQAAMLRLHVLAPMRLTQAALPVLLANRRGGIINVSSVASFIFAPGHVNYCASKAYLTTFTEGLAAELAGTGVRAQALCPGFTHTEFHQRMGVPKDRVSVMWMSAESVVRASLRSFERGGPVVFVPGVRYKVLALVARVLPRTLLGRLTGRPSSKM
jgi:uncharacterized protein